MSDSNTYELFLCVHMCFSKRMNYLLIRLLRTGFALNTLACYVSVTNIYFLYDLAKVIGIFADKEIVDSSNTR